VRTSAHDGIDKIEAETLQFVVHRHERPGDLHWDLMLERPANLALPAIRRPGWESGLPEEALLTWRVDTAPERLCGGAAAATRLFDHSRRFLTYEGPVSQSAATVHIVDRGRYELVGGSCSRLDVLFHGATLTGPFTLSHVEGESWRLQTTAR